METTDNSVRNYHRNSYLELHKLLCDEARALSEKKNKDYTGKDGTDPFGNFKRCELMGICSTEQGILVRLTDKMSRLSTFAQSGSFEVADESLKDTCMDVINYIILMYAFVQEKENAK